MNKYFDECNRVVEKSLDTTKVGVVLVKNKEIILTAWNDFPLGIKPSEQKLQRPQKYNYISHTEEQLIAKAAKFGITTDGLIVYINLQPCINCTRLLINAGIKEIHCTSRRISQKWFNEFLIAEKIIKESNTKLIKYSCIC